jgi:RNase adapter protein RapZ
VMLDVRFLPNPFFVEALRLKTGIDQEVAEFVLQQDDTQRFLTHLEALLETTLPLYIREGKSYLTVAIGCTGGRHRSVAIAEALANRVQGWGYAVQVRHRDRQR